MTEKKRKILYVCTEDWFFHSHFLPLLDAARQSKCDEIYLATSTGGKHEELENSGVNIIKIDFDRASKGVFSTIRLLRQLGSAIRQIKPDIIHLISLKPVLVGGLICWFFQIPAKVFHITGLGTLGEGNTWQNKLLRALVFRMPALYLRQENSELLVENPDDLAYLQDYGLSASTPATILGGAGVDPDVFPDLSLLPAASSATKTITLAFVGRMIKTKGVDVLVDAMATTHVNTLDVHLELHGIPDQANPGSYNPQTLEDWGKQANITYHGYSADVVAVWKAADICIVPTRTREGLPRAMLEAAVCARPLIVTDVPGCRHFVRDGIEGFVVPPENAEALGEAIARLATDRSLRMKMGEAARKQVLSKFTKQHVVDDVVKTYCRLLQNQHN